VTLYENDAVQPLTIALASSAELELVIRGAFLPGLHQAFAEVLSTLEPI
jgi:hypothetical protein